MIEKERKKKTSWKRNEFVKKTGLCGGLKARPCEKIINPLFVEIESRLIEARVRDDCTGPDNVAGPYIILNYIGATSVRCVHARACVYKDPPSTLKSLTVSGEKRLCRRIDNIRFSARLDIFIFVLSLIFRAVQVKNKRYKMINDNCVESANSFCKIKKHNVCMKFRVKYFITVIMVELYQ